MMKNQGEQRYYNTFTGAMAHPYDWQWKLRKGSYFRILSEYIVAVYGQVLETLPQKGYFRVMAYSAVIPVGHKSVLCVVEPTRLLTRREFEEAKARGWRPREDEVQ
jgi:hypothetical protein